MRACRVTIGYAYAQILFFFFSSRRRHTRYWRDWSSDVCSSDLKRGAFIQSYETMALDAANLLMPLVFFLSPVDPRMLSTLDILRKPPAQGGLTSDGLVFRYDAEATSDGVSREREGTFNLCTFWLVEAMTRASVTKPQLLDEARLIFERMLGYANHLGLYAEQ